MGADDHNDGSSIITDRPVATVPPQPRGPEIIELPDSFQEGMF